MHLRSLKKTKGEVSLYDPIGVDKEGNEITSALYLGFRNPNFIYFGSLGYKMRVKSSFRWCFSFLYTAFSSIDLRRIFFCAGSSI